MKQKLPRLSIGVEIECAYDSDRFDLTVGNYHEGQPVTGLPGWRVEEDGSLNVSTDRPETFRTAEFVSKRCKGISDLRRTLQLFKAYFSKSGKLQLKDVMEFNDSTGAHVHISTTAFKFTDRAVFSALVSTRNNFKNSIKNSALRSKDQILGRYFRSYAEETTRDNRYEPNKYREFNIRSEQSGQGLEWRSPNMTGISTWEEFAAYWEIVFASIEVLAKKTLTSEDYEEFVVEREDNSVTITTEQTVDIATASEVPIFADHIPSRRTKRTHSRFAVKILPVLYDTEETIYV